MHERHDDLPPAALDSRARDALAAKVDAWEQTEVASFVRRAPERASEFATIGGFPVKRAYTALDIADTPLDDIGLPGQYPFTRGPYPTMYRGRLWTMRQIAGFGTAEDTNQRFKYLIAQGQTGLSTDFDMPTLMGYDSDHPMSEGEVGREGVAIDTLADMEHLFDGIDLDADLGVDDDQPERVDPARDVRRARAASRLRPRQAVRHDPGGHPEGIPGAEGVGVPGRAVGADRPRLHHVLRAAHEALQPDQHLGLSHLRSRRLAARRGRVHDVQPDRLRRGSD